MYAQSAHAVSAPAGTPKEIVSILSNTINKTVSTTEVKDRFAGLGVEARFMDTAQAGEFWAATEADIAPFVEVARASANR